LRLFIGIIFKKTLLGNNLSWYFALHEAHVNQGRNLSWPTRENATESGSFSGQRETHVTIFIRALEKEAYPKFLQRLF